MALKTLAVLAALAAPALARPAYIGWNNGAGYLVPYQTRAKWGETWYQDGNYAYIVGPLPTNNHWTFAHDQPTAVRFVEGQVESPFCLDAGLDPNAGSKIHIWKCNGEPQQTWLVTDERFQLAGTNLCLDVPDGDVTKNTVQLWDCQAGNKNQVFEQFCGSRGTGPYPSGG